MQKKNCHLFILKLMGDDFIDIKNTLYDMNKWSNSNGYSYFIKITNKQNRLKKDIERLGESFVYYNKWFKNQNTNDENRKLFAGKVEVSKELGRNIHIGVQGLSRGGIITFILIQKLLANYLVDRQFKYILKTKADSMNERILALQARDELNIKSALGRSLVLRNGQASQDIQQFNMDPLAFMSKNAISGDSMTKMGRLPTQGRAQLVKIDPHSYAIEYVYHPLVQNENLSVDSYFLGYNGANQSAKNPAYIDIPIIAAENSFVFTGSLTGCSVVVTKLNDTTYRVYHDGRVNSSLLYDNVMMAFDYRDYQISGTDEGLGMAYMHFKNGQWQLILQRQEYKVTRTGVIPVLRGNEASISILYADEQWTENNLQKFLRYREQVHNKLKELASRYEINTNNIVDSHYVDGDFSLTHQAIEPWLNLINQIKSHIERVHDTNTQRFLLNEINSVLSEAKSVERSWLWLQIKNKQGFESVVQVDVEALGSGLGNISIDRRYDLAVRAHIRNNNVEFNEGNEKYKEIVITGFSDGMTSTEMKSLYLNNNLSIKERGALYHHIEDSLAKEYIDNILKLSAKVNILFQRHGAIYTHLAPQDFYLPLMGDNSGGRCYPLVRAMAVALANKGRVDANVLLNKLFLAAGAPTEENSILLKTSLKNLHSNVDAVQASSSHGQFNLNEIHSKLIEASSTEMYALVTRTHAMLIGKTVNEDNVSYHFYDPNFINLGYDNVEHLFSALNEFFIKNKMASTYKALGSKSIPTFELISINTEAMGEVSIGNGIKVSDLSNNADLYMIASQQKELNHFIEQQNNITKDLQIRSSLELLKAEQWGKRVSDAYNILISTQYRDNDPTTVGYLLYDKWLPNFSNIEAVSDEKYRIQFISQEDTLNTRWVETTDKTFIEFKEYYNNKLQSFKKIYSFENGEFQRETHVSNIEHIDGINAGMALQTLFQYISNKNRNEMAYGGSLNLKVALKIHSYVNYAMIAHGTVSDTVKVTKLVHSLWKQGNTLEKEAMESFSASLARSAGEKLAVVLQVASVGLDIYELANAENEPQREVYATQLIFDTTILATSVVEYGASIAAIESLQGVFGPLAVPLMGIGIGITELVKINAQHAQEAASVGAYFATLKRSYENAHLIYDTDRKLILPSDNVVYKSINFRNGELLLDSQYIYRGKEGVIWTGEAFFPRNIITDFGSNPGSDTSKDKAINVREAVGVTHTKQQFDKTLFGIVVLPVVPKSYIDYEYGSLAGATSRDDNGFSILRNMEWKYQFYFDFYHALSEKIITKLHFEYEYTTMSILLDKKDAHLIVPNIPEEYRNKLLHFIKGYGGSYRININHGAALRLQDEAVNDECSKWIIDASFVDGDRFDFYNNRIEIDGVPIYIDELGKTGVITIVNKMHELYQYKLANSKLTMQATDASQWQDDSGDELDEEIAFNSKVTRLKKRLSFEQYFNQLESKNFIDTPYIVVHNYQHNHKNVGRSYYDTKHKRMIFTEAYGKQYRSGVLSLVDNDYAYFISDDKTLAWYVDINSGKIKGTYDFSKIKVNNDTAIVNYIWKRNDLIFIEASIKIRDKEVIARFTPYEKTLLLNRLTNNSYLLDNLANTATENLPDKFKFIDYLLYHPSDELTVTEKNNVLDSIYNDDVLEIDGKDSNGINRRYWLRMSSNTLIKPNIESSIHSPNNIINNKKWTPPDDVKLGGSLIDDTGNEIFFFFSKKENKVYRQEGLGQDKLDDNVPTAKIIADIPFIDNVIQDNGKLLLIGEFGGIEQIYADGSMHLVAFNKTWLKNTSNNMTWWMKLEQYYTDLTHPIALLGLKDLHSNLVPAWYFKGKTIIAKSLASSHKLNFVGFSDDYQGGYILDTITGKLHYQKAVQYNELEGAFGESLVMIEDTHFLPEATIIYPNLIFKDVKLVDGGLLLIMENNGVIYHPVSNDYEVRNKYTLGSSLVINGTNYDDFLHVNKIGDVKHLTVSGGEGIDIYKFNYQDWQQYDSIIIDNYAVYKEVDYIDLSIDDGLDKLFIKRSGDDLVVFDIENKTSLILMGIYSSKYEYYRHFEIRINDNVYNLHAEFMADFFRDKNLSVAILTLLVAQSSSNAYQNKSKSYSVLSEQISQMRNSGLSSSLLNNRMVKPLANDAVLAIQETH
ncbi:TcdA/TcdB pore-forming domain-containing protein [Providencia manganoxydans]|uniref:TcdA/TcdB toxin pore forming domain-containing protein n=1 Tax=Providencia manganoxydans TaxID=2923283 RepID=A0ABX7AHR7_9GAMM|nr:hypothetical protein JI723_05540 [Providencia manganoxydans]